ncbi:PREDICTED: myosin-binding protein 3-like [Tarenaya hassleriana]|uniref:myosin-binding protein 3-like n=1 Tax=Tarenaya hassleriana TaxID=28532 RepID=UPI00053C21F4|nr:PREDICTED: myosin-binding protein 3-like [Tarenaya hassleriana]
MAANRFATMLSRNTNRITVILVYAVLEWLLIVFLFLHSLFTYLLVKFASYFGLKQICLLCSRLDPVFERNPETGLAYKELICENHAVQLSGLSFCKNHRKFADSMKMCSDCSGRDEDKAPQRSINFAFCACCQKSSEKKTYPNYLLLKSSSWGDSSLGYKENGVLILEMIDDDKIGDGFEKERESDRSEGKGQEQNNGEVVSDVDSYGLSLREVSEEDGLRSISTNFLGDEDEISEIQHFSGQLCFKDDDSVKIMDLSDHETVACDPGRLIPVELIDSSTITNHGVINLREQDQAPQVQLNDNAGNVPTCADGRDQIPGNEEETEGADLLDEPFGTKKLDSKPEDESSFIIDKISERFCPLLTGGENVEEGDDDQGQGNEDQEEEEEEEEETEEQREEKLPETPTSGDTLNSLHKKLLLLDGKRESSAEESVDEGIATDTDSGDPYQTIEKLATSVKAEREALRLLYAELEEERSASAIAANQTMAMITRLQEEKAKVQMEALQYQRMMEEQAEYDQEALQLLNDLMVKREKEKEEIQKELEVYRKKVLEYEAREKKESTHDDGVDDENEDDGDQGESSEMEMEMDLEKITMDCVKHVSMLDESLTEFEEERLAIMDQLKLLEEKLLTMQEDESAETARDDGFPEKLTMASMAKSLLPLLDAAENETEDGFQEEPESMERSVSLGEEKLEIIKQVDNVYERLQALETDGEFLKNCMSSVKKGDKGVSLLQEILQHLRDLRSIEDTES